MRRNTAILAGALLVAVLGGLAFHLTRAVPVEVITAAEHPIRQSLVFSGRVEAPVRVDLGATITGRVAEVRVREGDRVRRGDLLVALESADLQAQLAQARASESLALERVSGQHEVGQPSSAATLAQAQATLEAALREDERTRRLVAQGFVSQARADDTRRAVQVARAQVESARASARANAGRGTEVTQARLRAQEAAAAVALAEARLGQTRILAPADGRIVSRGVEPGQIVQPGKALIAFAADGATQLVAAADEKFLSRLAPGQPARIVADAFPEQPFDATLTSIAPGVDPLRGTVEVKFLVGQPPPFLREDMTLSIDVEVGRRERAITLPTAAVIGSGTTASVHLAVDGRVRQTSVVTGLRSADRVEIVSGLAADAAVILAPLAAEPGSRIRARRIEEPVAGARRAVAGEAAANPMMPGTR